MSRTAKTVTQDNSHQEIDEYFFLIIIYHALFYLSHGQMKIFVANVKEIFLVLYVNQEDIMLCS